jgi:hypothetical protein
LNTSKALIKEASQIQFFAFCDMWMQLSSSVDNGDCQATKPSKVVILDFPASTTEKNKFLFLVDYPDSDILVEHPKRKGQLVSFNVVSHK